MIRFTKQPKEKTTLNNERKVKIKFGQSAMLFVVLSLIAGSTYAVDPPAMEWHKGHGTSFGTHVHEGFQTSDGGFNYEKNNNVCYGISDFGPLPG